MIVWRDGEGYKPHQAYVISRVFSTFFQEGQSALNAVQFALQNLDTAIAYIRIGSLPVNACHSSYVIYL